MGIEHLHSIPEFIAPIEYLVAIAIVPMWLKRKLKSERSGDPDDADLEISHDVPRFMGGTDDEDNLRAVTRPEHAFSHYVLAQATRNKKEKSINLQAVESIVTRMTKDELKLFNLMLRRKRS